MIWSLRGIDVDEKPPTTAILRSWIKTVISGRAGAPVASITVTCVTARIEPAGLEQPNKQIAAKKYVKWLVYLMRRPRGILGYWRRLYFFNTVRSSSCGSAITRWLSMPVMVSAAIMALTTASSVAWMVAAKMGSILSLGSILRSTTWSGAAAPGFAVENATKMSPDPFPEILPSRPNDKETRRATRLSWWATSGASVATT